MMNKWCKAMVRSRAGTVMRIMGRTWMMVRSLGWSKSMVRWTVERR